MKDKIYVIGRCFEHGEDQIDIFTHEEDALKHITDLPYLTMIIKGKQIHVEPVEIVKSYKFKKQS